MAAPGVVMTPPDPMVLPDTSSINVYFTGYDGAILEPVSETTERSKLTAFAESVTSIDGVTLHLFFGNTLRYSVVTRTLIGSDAA